MMDDEVTVVEEKLSDSQLCVVYTGTSNFRILSAADLSGQSEGNPPESIHWSPGDEHLWSEWERLARSRERALEVFRVNGHEFKLVGPGAEEMLNSEQGEEEFALGGSVE